MSHDDAQAREDLDILLTAYALGELSGADQAAVERLLADPAAADARAHVAEVRGAAAALKALREQELPERSADLRKAVLTAAVGRGAVTPAEAPQAGRRGGIGKWILSLGSCAAVALVAAAMLLPAVQSARETGEEMRTGRLMIGAGVNSNAGLVGDIASNDTPVLGGEVFRGRMSPARLAARAGGGKDTQNAIDKAFRHLAEEQLGERDAVPSAERYNRFTDNPFRSVGEQPLSTFSIDVDTASYANVRRFLTAGQRPPRDAVRIEELVNYFRYDYPEPKGDEPFSVTVDAAACPWREGHRLVRVGLQGRDVARDARPAGNLVFLVDVSGSMDEPDKLPLVQRALLMLVDELTENDRVAIVTYAGNAGLVLPSTSGDQKQKIRAAMEALRAGGSTHGSAGINLAYEQAAERFIQGGANRVILCTDGDLNVGVTSDDALVDLIKQKAAGGTFLTVLGFGTGNLQDEKIEKLANNGNGVYAYIDGVREARKVLVEELTGSTITIAKDVKIQVEFNPAQVASYRLLGYENRVLAAKDFRDDKKDAGEIGAGHTVTALYEIVLVGDRAGAAAARGAEPLKYQPAPAPAPPAAKPTDEGPASRELLTVKLRWKKPEADTSTLLEVPLEDKGGGFDAAPTDLRFAAAVAAFGMLLRESEHKGTATLSFVAEIAGSGLGRDAGGYRAEFLDLVRQAEALR
jgi:secreted protein with Ig-like and vWFA domain